MSLASTLPNQERTGSLAKLRTIRMSAFKARPVLKLISGKSYEEAIEILTFCDRVAADEILKCLNSAAANAEHNESLDPEELFVSECFANEGPTLKRWRPRARGRATRIYKRTCHITIVLSRYTAEELLDLSERTSSRSGTAAADRRRRVAASQSPVDTDEDIPAVDEDIPAVETEEAATEAAVAATSGSVEDSVADETPALDSAVSDEQSVSDSAEPQVSDSDEPPALESDDAPVSDGEAVSDSADFPVSDSAEPSTSTPNEESKQN